MENSIEEWIKNGGASYKLMRQAVHIILKAISIDGFLSETMVMKGGTLLGVRHGSDRYTTDIDFSTENKYQDFDFESFIVRFNNALDNAESQLAYGMKSKVQSYKVQPNAKGTFPTVKMKIAYCERRNVSHMTRLDKGDAPMVISIDFSFNEKTYNLDFLNLSEEDGDEDENIKAYSLIDLLAEKYRSILQQKIRERNREQDIYDVHYLLKKYPNLNKDDKYNVLDCLFKKSEGRGLDELLNKDGIRDDEIVRRSKERYSDLTPTVKSLPSFESAYNLVADFYESLPWGAFDVKTDSD